MLTLKLSTFGFLHNFSKMRDHARVITHFSLCFCGLDHVITWSRSHYHQESCNSYDVSLEVVYDSISYGSGLFINCAISKLSYKQLQLCFCSVRPSAHKTSSSTLIVYTIRPQDGKSTSTRTNRRLNVQVSNCL